ncbi:MAG: hypothetical protein ACRD97_03280 [Nitrososphaeraceae archaeon]
MQYSLGTLLSLRHSGRYELFFIDAHVDFYESQAATSSGSRWFYCKEFRSSLFPTDPSTLPIYLQYHLA